MDFKTAMEHVQDGTATEEERRLVDSEVDKYLLITEHLDARWEREAPPMPEVLPELIHWLKILLTNTDFQKSF